MRNKRDSEQTITIVVTRACNTFPRVDSLLSRGLNAEVLNIDANDSDLDMKPCGTSKQARFGIHKRRLPRTRNKVESVMSRKTNEGETDGRDARCPQPPRYLCTTIEESLKMQEHHSEEKIFDEVFVCAPCHFLTEQSQTIVYLCTVPTAKY